MWQCVSTWEIVWEFMKAMSIEKTANSFVTYAIGIAKIYLAWGITCIPMCTLSNWVDALLLQRNESVCLCINVCMHIYIYTHTCVCFFYILIGMCVCIYIYRYTSVDMCVLVCVCMCIYIYIYIYRYVYTYLFSNISSTESNVKIHIGRLSTAVDRLSTKWKSVLSDKIKWDFF